MTKLVSMDEVFSMAVHIERNGAKFYRKAAELHKDDDDYQTFMKLALVEDGHAEKFEAMRKAAAENVDAPGELQTEGAMYLDAIYSGYRVEGSPKVTDSLTGDESVRGILETAARLEQQSILFYLGIQRIVSDSDTKKALDEIIDEERLHVVALMQELHSDLLD